MMREFDGEPPFPMNRQGCIFEVLFFLSILAALALTSSCKTTRIIEKEGTHDTLVVATLQKDSIYLHDSIYQERWREGDTVYMYKYIEHTKYKDRIKHDSIYISKSDTIVKTIEVEKKKSLGQRIKDKILTWMLILLIVAVIVYAIKKNISSLL